MLKSSIRSNKTASLLQSDSSEFKNSLFLGIATGLAYLLWLCPSIYWRDAGELSAAAFTLGVAHPTGFPGYLLFAKLASFIPFGQIAFRINLLSAASGVAVVIMSYHLSLYFIASRSSVDRAAAGVAALLFGFGSTAWLHATTAEVYLPNMFMVLLLLTTLLRADSLHSSRWLRVSAVITGIGLGFHASFVIAAAVLWPVILIRRWHHAGPSRKAIVIQDLIWTSVLVLLGACVVLYLPIRAAQSPWRNWGNPVSASALWDHLTGARIRSAFAGQMGGTHWDIDLVSAIGQLSEQVSWGGLVAVVGIVAIGFKRPFAGLVLMLLWLSDLAFTVLLNPMGMHDHQTGLLTVFTTVQAFAVGVALVGPTMRRGFPRYGAAAATFIGAIGLVTPAILHGGQSRDNSNMYQALDLGEQALERLPSESLVLVSSDDMASSATYLQGVENVRPDVAVVVKQHIADVDYLALLRSAHGSIQLTDGFWQALEQGQSVPDLVMRLVNENLEHRAVYWELGDPILDSLTRSKINPALPLFRIQPFRPFGFERTLVDFRIRWRILGYDRWNTSAQAALAHRLSLVGAHFVQLGRMDMGGRLAVESYNTYRLDPGVINNFAHALQLHGDFKAAARQFENLVSLRPGYDLGWFNLGTVRFNQKDQEGMRNAFFMATTLGTKRSRVARMAWYTAVLYVQENKLARAYPLLLAAHTQLGGSLKESAEELLEVVERELAR